MLTRRTIGAAFLEIGREFDTSVECTGSGIQNSFPHSDAATTGVPNGLAEQNERNSDRGKPCQD
jgi:hypothetical protein